jgi:orotidine-5'-phosphate decarboxylase
MENHSFADRLIDRSLALGSPICVGIDPRPELLPSFLRVAASQNRKQLAAAYFHLSELLIEAVFDLVPVIKLQVAFFEALGAAGIDAFWNSTAAAQDRGLLVIGDAKRGDIGSTAAAYATAFFGDLNGSDLPAVDAITLNPYLGRDSVEPFLEHVRLRHRGLFLLARTSNPSARDFQDLELRSGLSLAEHVSNSIASWGSEYVGRSGYSSIGLVAGATYPNELRKIRKSCPSSPLLVPGFGTQGGTPETVAASLDARAVGSIISSSREIMAAAMTTGDSRKDAIASVRHRVQTMRDLIIEAKRKLDENSL